jgi:transcription antitermination factor NusG
VNLQRQGFLYYNPKIQERVKLKHGYGQRIAQMFANYLFIDIADEWRAVKSTIGISHLLMQESEKPGVLKDEFITTLKAQENQDGFIILKKSKFIKHEPVHIKSGPFAYAVGCVDGMSSQDRVYVLLSFLGAQRRVEMREDNLIAA